MSADFPVDADRDLIGMRGSYSWVEQQVATRIDDARGPCVITRVGEYAVVVTGDAPGWNDWNSPTSTPWL
jgi:hypothetical protein